MNRPRPVKAMMESNLKSVNKLGHYLAYLNQYRPMYISLVSKEFKGKFKYTSLGYFWHLLNPLAQIMIYYVVFTTIFGRDIPNYWLYISTGMFTFVFLNSNIAGACNIIIVNKNLITKIAFPREITIFARVTSNLITLITSYVLIILLIIMFQVNLSWSIGYLPIIILIMAIFSTGTALVFSAVTIYFRDVANATAILMGCMMFAIPIMYLSAQRSTPMMDMLWHINPLFYFVETIHDILYYGFAPDIVYVLICASFASISLILGIIVFKKIEKGFAERL